MRKDNCIYIRISTGQQNIDRQDFELRALCRDRGWNLKDENVFTDVISGYVDSEERPAFIDLKNKVRKGEVERIIFSEFSRCDRNATALLNNIKWFKQHGVTTYFHKQNLMVSDLKSDLGSDILLHVLAVVSDYEVQLFAERSIGGKIAAIKNKSIGIGGTSTYGYYNHPDTKVMTIHPEESKVVQRIFLMYAEGKSSFDITIRLNAEGIPSPIYRRIQEFKNNRENKGLKREKEYKYYDNDDMKWKPSAINRMIRYKWYIGEIEYKFHEPEPENKIPYHKRTNRKVLEVVRKHDESIRIISDELFYRVQKIVDEKRFNRNLGIKHENFIKDKLVCGHCEGNFGVSKTQTKEKAMNAGGRGYRCYQKLNRIDHPKTCSDGVEVKMWKLDGLIATLSIYMFAKNDLNQSSSKKIEENSMEILELSKIKIVKEEELDNAKSAYKKKIKRLMLMDDDDIVQELTLDAKNEYECTKEELEDEIFELSNRIAEKQNLISSLDKMKSLTAIRDRMYQIKFNKRLIKSMVGDYIKYIKLYRVNNLWSLVIVRYQDDSEMWGTVKIKKYKKEESYYDGGLYCQEGIEYKTWFINNSDSAFSYDKEKKLFTYKGSSILKYEYLQTGTYTFDELNELFKENDGLGSYPLYDFEGLEEKTEEQDKVDNSKIIDFSKTKTKYDNDKVIERLKSKLRK